MCLHSPAIPGLVGAADLIYGTASTHQERLHIGEHGEYAEAHISACHVPHLTISTFLL